MISGYLIDSDLPSPTPTCAASSERSAAATDTYATTTTAKPAAAPTRSAAIITTTAAPGIVVSAPPRSDGHWSAAHPADQEPHHQKNNQRCNVRSLLRLFLILCCIFAANRFLN